MRLEGACIEQLLLLMSIVVLYLVQVVMIPGAREIALSGGNIHCITQQHPVGLV